MHIVYISIYTYIYIILIGCYYSTCMLASLLAHLILQICPNGQLFHIDFGFIFGQDPKPLPPPFRSHCILHTIMLDYMFLYTVAVVCTVRAWIRFIGNLYSYIPLFHISVLLLSPIDSREKWPMLWEASIQSITVDSKLIAVRYFRIQYNSMQYLAICHAICLAVYHAIYISVFCHFCGLCHIIVICIHSFTLVIYALFVCLFVCFFVFIRPIIGSGNLLI